MFRTLKEYGKIVKGRSRKRVNFQDKFICWYLCSDNFQGIKSLELIPKLNSKDSIDTLCNFLTKCPNLQCLSIKFGEDMTDHDQILSKMLSDKKKLIIKS